ncbi:MAG: ABC transporter ATP-binding protein [Lentisphaeria bacterium]|nr:ABC transporter ATP-binding protein [Lentisphaeria bacterium]
MDPIIEIRGLRKTFRRTVAVEGLDLDVPEGAITAFLGPNGAGKTTTIKCVLNILAPDSGTIRVLGCDSRCLGPAQFCRIGYVSENQELPLWMTVDGFLAYCRAMYPSWDAGFEAKLRLQFDLPGCTKLGALSRGMRMKAALLSSLAYRPGLVVLDEPFTGLDPLVRDEFIRGLLELTEDEGWSVFISSHDIDEVERLADRVAILDRGRLRLAETTEALQARFRRVEVVLDESAPLPPGLPSTWLNPEMAVRTLRFVDSAYRDPDALTAALAAHVPGARQHHAAPMPLREIFVALARSYKLDGLHGNGGCGGTH